VKKVIKEIEAIFNRSGLTANIKIKKTNIMLGLYGGDDLDVIFNITIFISKWEIWKIRQYGELLINFDLFFTMTGCERTC
jgi:hypothetical protein